MDPLVDTQELWTRILKRLEPEIKKPHFLTWFQDTAILSFEDGILTVGVPTFFAREWLQNKLNGHLLKVIKEIEPAISQVIFKIESSLSVPGGMRGVQMKEIISPGKKVRKAPRKQEVMVKEGEYTFRSKYLNPRYRLENFIVGPENRMAHAACLTVSRNPGGTYNPLFVFGGVGLGKTHLIQATGSEILRNFPDKVVVYVTSERFANEIIDAIQRGQKVSMAFKQRYRKVDCLIVDDIQFFANKDITQGEFFHTFNELYDNGKQIILSSDRPPNDLDGFEARLKSRFEMGMVVDVQFPDFETRLAILHAKCREHQVLIPPEVLEFIAYNVHHSVRELEGILLQAIAQAQLDQRTPTVREVAQLFKKFKKDEIVGFEEGRMRRPLAKTAEEVMEIVADYYRVTKSDLEGVLRKKEVMLPRQIAMYLIRKELDCSFEKIGADFGGRNHTTVSHACERIIRLLRRDHKLVRDINALKKEMGL